VVYRVDQSTSGGPGYEKAIRTSTGDHC